MKLRIFKDSRRCRFHFESPIEIMKPPISKKMMGSAKGMVLSFMVKIPRAGKSTIGSKAVIGIGIACVAHQVASNNAIPAVCQAEAGISSGTGNIIVINKKLNPRNNPILLGERKLDLFPTVLTNMIMTPILLNPVL